MCLFCTNSIVLSVISGLMLPGGADCNARLIIFLSDKMSVCSRSSLFLLVQTTVSVKKKKKKMLVLCKQICWLLKVNVVIPGTKRLQGFSVWGNLWVKCVLFATRWQPFIFSTEGSVKKCRREFYQLYSLLWKVHYRDHVVPCVNNRFHFIERKWISILRPTKELT